jgi:MFS transporter
MQGFFLGRPAARMQGYPAIMSNTESLRRNRDFRWLLAGSSVSMLGSRLTTIGYPMLVLFLHGTPVLAGLAVFAASAPSVLVYIPAGALVDRWDDPKKTLLIAEAGRGIAIGLIVVLLLLHRASIPLIIVVAIFEESLEVFAMLAERRYVRLLVEPAQASSAQVGMEARAHVVVLVGRALGGLLFGLRPVLPFLTDAVTFLVSVVALFGIHTGEKRPVRQAPAPRSHLAHEVRDGLRELRKDAFARDASLLSAGMTLVSQALIIVFLAEAHSRQVSSLVIGSVLAASGIGGLLGALLGQRERRHAGLSPLRIQPFIWAVMLAVLAISGGWQVPRVTLVIMALVMMVLGIAGAMGNVELDTYLILKVPDKKLARVTSIEMLLDFAASAIGPALGGLFTELWGTGDALWALFGLTVLFMVCGRFMRDPAMQGFAATPAQAAVVHVSVVPSTLAENAPVESHHRKSAHHEPAAGWQPQKRTRASVR